MPKYIPFLKYFIMCFILLTVTMGISPAANEEPEEEYKLQRYDEIKRRQEKEFKKGAINDNEKDYVGGWIGEDIKYQKKVIKLKKDYRTWALDRESKNNPIDFEKYAKENKLNRVERQILLEYHNMFFKTGYDQKKVAGKPEKKQKKKIVKAKTIKKSASRVSEIKAEISIITPENEIPAESVVISHEIASSVKRVNNNDRAINHILFAVVILLGVSFSAFIIVTIVKNYRSKTG